MRTRIVAYGMKNEPEFNNVTEVPEDELVRWLFHECPVREQIFEALELSRPSCVHRKVSQNDLSLDYGPGDVDLLLVPWNNAAEATAIECKRVKYQAKAVSTGIKSPNKLRDLRHGAQQANLLVLAGFHRVFLLVLIEVDARTHPAANVLMRGLSGGQAEFVHLTLSSLDMSTTLTCKGRNMHANK
jgi:hypothetical protein